MALADKGVLFLEASAVWLPLEVRPATLTPRGPLISFIQVDQMTTDLNERAVVKFSETGDFVEYETSCSAAALLLRTVHELTRWPTSGSCPSNQHNQTN